MFITNIFLQLIITVSIILILMSRKYYMGLCMLAGGIVLWLMRSGDPFLLATSFVSMLHQTRTYDLIISLITNVSKDAPFIAPFSSVSGVNQEVK